MLKTIILSILLIKVQHMHALGRTLWQFQCNAVSQTRINASNNFAMSPFVLQANMALLYMAAEGTTSDQLGKVLHFDIFEEKKHMFAEHGEMWKKVTTTTKVSKLVLANRIYVDREIEILPGFKDNISKKYFNTDIEILNSTNFDTKAFRKINKWIASNTQRKIKNVLGSFPSNANYNALIVSGIYFKSEWKYKFDAAYTKTRDFYLSANNKIGVPTMMRYNIFVDYAKVSNYEAIKLPFADIDLQMLIVRPNNIGGVYDFLENFNNVTFKQLNGAFKPHFVDVYLPKFRLELSANLVDILKGMGISTLFAGDTNLSGMSKQPLPIDIISQKTLISIDEKGADADGAAYTQSRRRNARTGRKQFIVDRPFWFGLINSSGIFISGIVAKF